MEPPWKFKLVIYHYHSELRTEWARHKDTVHLKRSTSLRLIRLDQLSISGVDEQEIDVTLLNIWGDSHHIGIVIADWVRTMDGESLWYGWSPHIYDLWPFYLVCSLVWNLYVNQNSACPWGRVQIVNWVVACYAHHYVSKDINVHVHHLGLHSGRVRLSDFPGQRTTSSVWSLNFPTGRIKKSRKYQRVKRNRKTPILWKLESKI